MSAAIRIELPGLPIGKGRPRFVRKTGHAFTPERTRNYETDLRFAGQDAMEGRAPLDGPVSISVTALFPIPQSWSLKKKALARVGGILPTGKPDVDNLLKCIGDSLNQIVFVDDKQIVLASIRKEYSERPRLIVDVAPFALPLERAA